MKGPGLPLPSDRAPQSQISFLVLFTLLSLGLFAYASYQLQNQTTPLQSRCEELHTKLMNIRRQKKEVSEIVKSLSDPAAEEYALITEFGRVPEGSFVILLSKSRKE